MNMKVSLSPLSVAMLAAARATRSAARAETKILRFDVAEDATRFVFDDESVFEDWPGNEDNVPVQGSDFATQGYLYPRGTLDGRNGVRDNGDPEFPERVIGRWTCRGVYLGAAPGIAGGPSVKTTQCYQLGDATTGWVACWPTSWVMAAQSCDVGNEDTDSRERLGLARVPIQRNLIGYSSRLQTAMVAAQRLLGFNLTGGVNLRCVG